MSTLQISLPDELRAWVESEARGNGYADVGEFVGVLVREVKAQREMQIEKPTDDEFLGGRTESELAALINEGLAGETEVANAQWWNDLRTELAAKLPKQEVAA